MAHDDDYRLELFIFPDGTAVEMIVFAQACTPSPDSCRPPRDRDVGPTEARERRSPA